MKVNEGKRRILVGPGEEFEAIQAGIEALAEGQHHTVVVYPGVTPAFAEKYLIRGRQEFRSIKEALDFAEQHRPCLVRLPPGNWRESITLPSFSDMIGSLNLIWLRKKTKNS